MIYKLGLTGSIGMGKSTTAQVFADQGCGVWDADVAVHRLYAINGAAVAPIAAVFPNVVKQRSICRQAVKQLISNNSAALKQIEMIVHPLVVHDRQSFIDQAEYPIIVFDIPLLFETGGQRQCNAVVCVYISPHEQRRRVMSRGTMTEKQLDYILSKQMPIAEKRALSDYQILTDNVAHVTDQVTKILMAIEEQISNA